MNSEQDAIPAIEGDVVPKPEQDDMAQGRQKLGEHLLELRRRLIWSFGALSIGALICYFFSEHIFSFLIRPLATAMGEESTHRLIYTGLTEAFFTTLKLSFFGGLFLTFPIILAQIWIFVAPGLYAREKRAFLPFLAATPVLFVLGGALVYYFVMPLAWKFFLGFQTSPEETGLPIQLEARIGDYLNLIISFIFAFGLCFQLPVVLSLMARAGMITADWLAQRRKFAIVIAFIVGGALTPPDVISQVSLAVPVVGLYEISILMIRYAERAHKRAVAQSLGAESLGDDDKI